MSKAREDNGGVPKRLYVILIIRWFFFFVFYVAFRRKLALQVCIKLVE